jgi:hypothetical protein
MRTTLTIDPDVARMLEDEVHRTRKPFKQVVNDAIRRGLAPGAQAKGVPSYRVKAHVAKLAPGIDPDRMNALVDQLEDEAIVEKIRRETTAFVRSRAAERKR